MTKFVGIIHKEGNSDYGVSFPDFPGCITAGSSMQEAFDMAQEALQAHIDVMHEFGDLLPAKPLTIDAAMKHPFAKAARTLFVTEADIPVKCRRINISMDEHLIDQIDKISANRSGFLTEAAREKLRHEML